MKILLIAPMPYFYDRGGPIRVKNMVTAASNLSHEVDILTYHVGEDILIPNTKIYRTKSIPIKPYSAGISAGRLVVDSLLLKKALTLSKKYKYDCIQGEDVVGGYIGHIIKNKINKPLIYDVHSSFSEIISRYAGNNMIKGRLSSIFQSIATTKIIDDFAKNIEKTLYKSSDVLIASWKLIAQYIKETVDKEAIVIEDTIPSIFEKSVDTTKTGNLRYEYNIEENETLLVYTGNFFPYQGVDVLIKSFAIIHKKHNHTKLMLVGDDIDGKSKQMVHKLGLDDAVIFTGQRPVEEMPIFLATANILLSALNYNGRNATVKIITYLSQNKPIVASNIPAYTQILDDKIAFLAPPTEKAFADKIDFILNNEYEAEKRAWNAYKYALEKFSFETFQRKMEKVYKMIE